MRRQLILPIGRRSGKCVVGDTLVLTSKGIFRIEDLGVAPEEDAVPALIDIVQEAGRRSTATSFYNGGVKPTFKFTTESGYTETGTGNHRIKVMSSSGFVEWRYLDEIQIGDFIAINRTTDLWPSELLDL
jgi:intein/homing endonuclease